MNDLSTVAVDLERNEHVDLSETDRHALLASDRRRHLVRILSERDAPVELSDLAVAVHRSEADSTETTTDSTGAISIELHHNHLPRLDQSALVDYVSQTHRVEAIRF